LEEGETILRKNKIEIKDKKNVDNIKDLKYELGTKIYQKPNSKFLGVLPSLGPWYYYRIQAKSDTTWWGRFVLRNFAEIPAVYNSSSANSSAENMEKALRNKGYFDAEVDFETKQKGLRKKKTHITYNITAGKRYYLDGVNFTSNDTSIHRILQEIKSETLLPPGVAVDREIYDEEIRRLTLHLLNNGYANFYTRYFSKFKLDAYSADSLDHNLKNVELEVLLPKDSSQHKTYSIGKVTVISMYDENGNPIMEKDSVFNNTHFFVGEGKHFIKLKALDRKIFLREGDIYRLENIDKTRVQLGSLDIFQFINIKRTVSEKADSILNYEIRLIPKKRQEIGVDFEFNNSTINREIASTTSGSFIGTGASLSYKNRNAFRGGEVFTARTEGGLEVEPRNNFQLNAWNVNLNFTIDFPKYHDLFKTDNLLIKLLSLPAPKKGKSFYKRLKERGVASTSLKYNVIANTGNYRIDILTGAWGWKFRPNNKWNIAVNKVGIDFFEPTLTQLFIDSTLFNNPFLERSFKPQLFTGLLIRDVNFLYQSGIGRGGKSSILLRGNFEISGAEVLLVNKLVDKNNPFKLANKYDFSQYAKLEGDFRYYLKGSGGRMLATRLNVGDTTTSFYQTGDFKFEVNAEWRFHMFWYFKGAVFVDAGNIWSLNKSDERDGAGLGRGDFFKEMAVNTGFGLRLDVEYFILRFDLGYKLRNPFPDENGDFWVVHINSLQKDLALNKFRGSLSVGYPF